MNAILTEEQIKYMLKQYQIENGETPETRDPKEFSKLQAAAKAEVKRRLAKHEK